MIRPRDFLGAGLVISAAFLLSCTSTTAVLTYRGGGDPGMVMIVRFCGGVMVLWGFLLVAGQGWRLPRRTASLALGIGLPQAVQAYFLYQSFATISIGLAMIIFYVYPLLVALMAGALGHDRLTPTLGLGLGIAFVGLVLVFDVSGAGLNMVGALNALGAAVSWGLVVVFSGRVAQGHDPHRVTLHVQASALALVLVVAACGFPVHVPRTDAGLAAVALLPLFYGTAMAVFFIAVSLIGPMRASLIMNIEAVFAVVLGYTVLQQELTPMQISGGCLVIAALLTAGRGRRLVGGNTEN